MWVCTMYSYTLNTVSFAKVVSSLLLSRPLVLSSLSTLMVNFKSRTSEWFRLHLFQRHTPQFLLDRGRRDRAPGLDGVVQRVTWRVCGASVLLARLRPHAEPREHQQRYRRLPDFTINSETHFSVFVHLLQSGSSTSATSVFASFTKRSVSSFSTRFSWISGKPLVLFI